MLLDATVILVSLTLAAQQSPPREIFSKVQVSGERYLGISDDGYFRVLAQQSAPEPEPPSAQASKEKRPPEIEREFQRKKHHSVQARREKRPPEARPSTTN
jgi:hypothetical protein